MLGGRVATIAGDCFGRGLDDDRRAVIERAATAVAPAPATPSVEQEATSLEIGARSGGMFFGRGGIGTIALP